MPRMVSAAAVKQSITAAAIINLNCIVSILRSALSSLKQHSVVPNYNKTTTKLVVPITTKVVIPSEARDPWF